MWNAATKDCTVRCILKSSPCIIQYTCVSVKVVNWHHCNLLNVCQKDFIPSPRVGSTYRLNLHWKSMRLQMRMNEYWGVWSTDHSLGPGWSWSSLQWAGSSAIRWAEAGRGAAWRAPSATPSQGRSEKTGHDSVTQSPSQYSRDPAFKSQQNLIAKQNM